MTNKKIPSGIYCLALMLQYFQKPADPNAILHEFSPDGDDFDITSLIRASKQLDLKSKKTVIKPKRLHKANFPFIACDNNQQFFIIAGAKEDAILIQRPGLPPQSITPEELWSTWKGTAVLLTDRSVLAGDRRSFDLSWFIPVIVKYRRVLKEVLLASFVIQIFALFTPLIFQNVMDKVLVHQALKTLDVLTVGLFLIVLFEISLEGLRSYLFSHTTSKIDIELGSRLFDHLLKLPLAFFQSRPVGQIVQRVQELENIRSFLTGNTLTVLLDLFFSIIFFAIMFIYSPTLTWIVLASIPFYIVISIAVTPEIRRRTEEKFQRGAITQSFLTESITGIETLKSMAVEPRMRKRWEDQLAAYVKASFRSNILGIYGGQSVQLVSKAVMALIMWQGALLVINGELTVGELIAFNMFSGQVAAPILRLAQLWQDFQQFKVSMERLGDLLNTQTEPQQNLNRPTLPDLKGDIEFRNITFRYSPEKPESIRNLNLTIKAEQKIGIAGTSGSGKSTLIKLIQRFYLPESGSIYLDGNDITLLDPAWLRRQIGVVMQDNMLFHASIRDNIAFTDRSLPMDKVIEAAQLAGAHEFILQLPHGYDTIIGERGTGLSGGQCQRIAIARAIINDPKILIFDEATSALDYESEHIIQNNMAQISSGRTIIVVAHRLSALKQCDNIIVMDHGQIIEQGAHDELIENNQRYATLWALQSGAGGKQLGGKQS